MAGGEGEVAVTVTAADILRWHFDRLLRDGESLIFAPVRGVRPTHDARQTWLRQSLLAALPLGDAAARRAVNDVSPHSFRSGLASDLLREGVSIQLIGSICRWNATRAIRLYAERPSFSMSRTTTGFRFIARRG